MKTEAEIKDLFDLVSKMEATGLRLGRPTPANVIAMRQTLDWVLDTQSPEDAARAEATIALCRTALKIL